MSITLAAPARNSALAAWLVVAWFGAVLTAAAAGVFVTSSGVPPVAIGVAAAGPPLAVAGALAYSASFRAWARSLDLRFLTMLQMWRVAGFVFLAFWAVDALPAGFALPAGIGDLIVGLTAPFVAVFMIGRGPAARIAYIGWTIFGILDLITAVTLGILHSDGPLGVLAHGSDTTVVTHLPLSLIPAFGVPLTLAIHAITLVNVAGSTQFKPR